MMNILKVVIYLLYTIASYSMLAAWSKLSYADMVVW